MEEAPTTKRGPGRPPRDGGPDPTRSAGRHGQIWDDCEAQAKTDGQTMTDFVRDAITRELDRRRAAAGPIVAADFPDLVRPVDNPPLRPVTFTTDDRAVPTPEFGPHAGCAVRGCTHGAVLDAEEARQ